MAVAAIITAIGGLIAAVYAARSHKYKTDVDKALAARQQEIDKHGFELEGVKVSVSSLQLSNAELRIDNDQLRQEIAAVKLEMRERDEECKAKIRVLAMQVIDLGGRPHHHE